MAIHGVGETPLAARDYLAQAIRRAAHGQNIFCAVRIIDGIAFSARGSEKEMSERYIIQFLGGSEIRTHHATNRLASRVVSNGSKEPEAVALLGEVRFPTDPGDGVAFAHEEAVAEFRFWIGRGYAVDDAQNSFSAAV